MGSEKDRVHKAYRQLQIMFALAVLFIILVMILYFSHFGVTRTFHEDRGVWGQFGDYMGGVLNPIIALFALWGIIQTIRLQGEDLKLSAEALTESSKSLAEQVIHMTQEKTLYDLRQAIEHTEREIDQLLDQAVDAASSEGKAIRLREIIETKANFLALKFAKTKYDNNEITNTSLEWKIVQEVVQLSIRFDRLARLLSQYEMTSGHSYFVSSVKSKYNVIVSTLFERQYLEHIGAFLLRIGELPEIVLNTAEPMKFYKTH